jgi:hypothetical protein
VVAAISTRLMAARHGAFVLARRAAQIPTASSGRLDSRSAVSESVAEGGGPADWPDPFNFINLLFAADSGLRSPAISLDAALEARIAAAARLSGTRRFHAYARLDRELAAGPAPLAAFANGTLKHFFSARVGCQFEHPIYGIDLAALSLRDDGGG